MDVAYLVELGLPVSHSLSVWCRCCASRVRLEALGSKPSYALEAKARREREV